MLWDSGGSFKNSAHVLGIEKWNFDLKNFVVQIDEILLNLYFLIFSLIVQNS